MFLISHIDNGYIISYMISFTIYGFGHGLKFQKPSPLSPDSTIFKFGQNMFKFQIILF